MTISRKLLISLQIAIELKMSLTILTRFDFQGLTYRLPAGTAITLSAALPSDGLGIAFCPFLALTSLPCPGCGLTRSLSSLLHMEVLKSWHYHPVGIPVFGVLVFMLVANRLPGSNVFPQKVQPFFSRVFNWKFVALTFLIVWILRLTAGLIGLLGDNRVRFDLLF